MTILEAIISGIVQGIAEFLPISSSGHLVLVHSFFGFKEPSMFFDICLHVATLGAVILFFIKDISGLVRRKDYKLLGCIIIGTIPAVLAAFLFEEKISGFFTDIRRVAFMFLVTAIALFAGQFAQWKRKTGGKSLAPLSALKVGLAQALALIPGISRSGITISTGIVSGIGSEDAFKFSFLLSIPVIAGAAVYKALKIDLASAVAGNVLNYMMGMIAAFFVGLISLYLLRKVIKAGRLYIFGVYCLILGVLGIFFL